MSDLLDFLLRWDYRHPRLVHAALEYASLGFRMIPLAGKTPFLERWTQRGTTCPHQLISWFEAWPDKNLGILTGDGFIVLDVDPKNGGTRSFRKFLIGRRLTDTATALTGSGGHHYLFKVDPALRIGNINGLMPGIDIKGEGGQFVAEPSVHPTTGREYVWLRTPRQGIAEAPNWLVNLLRGHVRRTGSEKIALRPIRLDRDGDESRQLALIIERFPVTSRGQRNDRMVRAISSLLGRGYVHDFTSKVVAAWWDHFYRLGTIGTSPSEAPRMIAASIRSILSSDRFRQAVGTDHRAELAKIEIGRGQSMMLDWVQTDSGLAIPPPLSNRVTHGHRLCRNLRERAFVESMVIYFTYKIAHLRENPLKATNYQFCWVMEDRHGIRLGNQQLERLVERYITRTGRPATRYELAIQTVKGRQSIPSEYQLTGLLEMMPSETLTLS